MLHHQKIYLGLGSLAVLISFALLDLIEPLACPLRMQNTSCRPLSGVYLFPHRPCTIVPGGGVSILHSPQWSILYPPSKSPALYCQWPSLLWSSTDLMVSSPHLLKMLSPGLVFLFNTTYKIILGIHLLDPTDNVSSQFLYILRSNNLSFHIITTSNDPTSEQSQFHAPSLYLASTSYLSSSLILVLSFLPFSDLSGTWNSWPHLFCPCPSLSSCPNFSPCPIYRPIVQHIYLNLWQTPLISWQLSYSIVLIWKERPFYWYPYTFCLHMHTQAATSGVSKLQSLGQMWTTSCFYKVVLAHSHIHSFMYCLFLLACHNGRIE